MAKVKNETGAPWVDARTMQRVPKGGVFEVPDDLTWSYVQSDNWSCADKATQALADKQRAAIESPPAEEPADVPTEES